LTKSTIRKISSKLQSQPRQSSRQIAEQLQLSPQTVLRAAHNLGLFPYHRPKKLILNNAQVKARLNFAKVNKHRDWSNVVYHDEKVAFLVAGPNSKNDVIWAPKGTTVLPAPYDWHSAKVNVAGGISRAGKSPIYIFEENLTADLCVEIFKSSIIPFGRKTAGNAWQLVMDGDPKHRSKTMTSFLAKKHVEWIRIPAKSPDFNLIENVWSMPVDAIKKESPKSKSALRNAIKKAWAKIPLEHIQNTLDSMPARLRAVIRNKGHNTKY
jgi:hypothetical protein